MKLSNEEVKPRSEQTGNRELSQKVTGRALRILIIAEYITPAQAVASIRWTKIGKYLAKNYDCTVDILTNAKDFSGKESLLKHLSATEYDETLALDRAYFRNIFQIKTSLLASLVHAAFIAGKRYRQKGSKEAVAKASPGSSCSKQEDRDAVPARRIGPWDIRSRIVDEEYRRKALKGDIDWSSYDVIVSTFGPKWTHYIAKRIKKQYPHIIWIADYRDAPFFSAKTFTRNNVDFARNHTAQADCVLAVSEKEAQNLFLPAGQPCRVIPNGFDPEEQKARQRKKADKFYLTYTGTLYSECNERSDLTPLFEALTQLFADGELDPEEVEVVYCGRQGDKFENQVSSYMSVPWRNLGFVPREQAIDIQNKSSLLLLCTWNTLHSRGIITGKIYEYFMSSVPILALCVGDVPNSKVKEMVEGSNVGFCYEEACGQEDFKKLLAFLREKYHEWKNGGLTQCNTNWDYVNSFRHDVLADQVMLAIQDAAKRKGKVDANR